MNIIAVANQKGGVGKTTTVVHLAHYFARKNQKVLVVDLDTQGHVAMSYNNDPGDGLWDVLLRRRRKVLQRRRTHEVLLQDGVVRQSTSSPLNKETINDKHNSATHLT